MASQPGFFDLSDRYEALSKFGDPLERLKALVDFESFRSLIKKELGFKRSPKGGRPPYDCILILKILILQTLYNLSDDQIEFQIKDRLSFMRFLSLNAFMFAISSLMLFIFHFAKCVLSISFIISFSFLISLTIS